MPVDLYLMMARDRYEEQVRTGTHSYAVRDALRNGGRALSRSRKSDVGILQTVEAKRRDLGLALIRFGTLVGGFPHANGTHS